MLRSWILFACCLGLLIPSVGLGAESLADFQVQFGLNSSQVAPRYRASISLLAGYLRNHPQTKITLAGHTDDSGPQALNVRLSHDRAAEVRNQLVNDFGIAKGRVGIAWLDSSRPVADNNSASGMARNRRVGIAFISSGHSPSAPSSVALRPAPVKPRPSSAKHSVAMPRPHLKPQPSSASLTKARPSMAKANLLEELPLHYAAGSLRPEEGTQELKALAKKLLENQDRVLKVEGFSQGPTVDLQLARKRVDAVRARLVFAFKVPARQVQVSWSGAPNVPGEDSGVGVLVKMFGDH